MRLVCCAIFLVTAALITSCDKQLNVDRAASPEASFEAARASLRSENMDGFFDALTDQAVRQILLNLLNNASKFVERGKITLEAEVAPPFLHIRVQDTGPGIPIDLQERIFEPFVTAGQASRRL